MSTVAKVFVVLNFLLAVVFLGSAAAMLGHSDNWKAKHDKKSQEFTDAQTAWNTERITITGERDKLASEKNKSDSDKNAAVAEAAALRTNLDSLQKSHNDLAASLAASTRALQVAQSTIQNGRTLVDDLQKERQGLIDNLTQARTQMDAAVKMQNQLELNLNDLQRQHQDSLAKLSSTETSLKHANFEIAQWKSAYPGAGPGTEQPDQSGRVLAVDNENNIIVISLGSEDGVKAGYRYTISRGSNYVAQIEITNVEAKQSAGRALPTSKGPSRPGDDVRTTMAPR